MQRTKQLYQREIVQLKKMLVAKILACLKEQQTTIYRLAKDTGLNDTQLYNSLQVESITASQAPTLDFLLKILITVSPDFNLNLSSKNRLFTSLFN